MFYLIMFVFKKQFFIFKKCDIQLWSFLIWKMKQLWNRLKHFFKGLVDINLITPQIAIFEVVNIDQLLFLILYYVLLLLKCYICVWRSSKAPSFLAFLENIKKLYSGKTSVKKCWKKGKSFKKSRNVLCNFWNYYKYCMVRIW